VYITRIPDPIFDYGIFFLAQTQRNYGAKHHDPPHFWELAVVQFDADNSEKAITTEIDLIKSCIQAKTRIYSRS
jgi:hypothetical protein